jgi:Uri superfamily endonuclease
MQPVCNEMGIYTLILRLEMAIQIKVGSLGATEFARGYYCYTGSAQGPGGLKRVDRHLQILNGIRSTRRWHIDYLLPNTCFQEVFITKTVADLECKIAKSISRKLKPVKGFGCTDCHCISHLHYSEDIKEMRETVRLAHNC